MKNIVFTLLFTVVTFYAASAQNIFVKPFGGSAFGFSSVENQTNAENFDAYSTNQPKYWSFNAYYGISLEWQKDIKNRFELVFAKHELALGHGIEYNSPVTGMNSNSREYSNRPTLNIAFNYGRTLGSFGLKTGKKVSFDGIIGVSFIKKSNIGFDRTSGRGSGIQDFHTLDIDRNTDFTPSFGLNLGFATRLHNAKGNAVLELRFQYIKSFVEMRYQTTKYDINGQQFEFRQSTNGSMINFAFGIPIRVLSTAK